MHRCAGGLWLQAHTARIATLLRRQNISLCALLISRLSYNADSSHDALPNLGSIHVMERESEKLKKNHEPAIMKEI